MTGIDPILSFRVLSRDPALLYGVRGRDSTLLQGTAQHSTVSNASGCCALRPVCSGVSPPLSLADLTHRRALILHQRFNDVGETEGREEVGFGAIGLVGHQTNGPASEEDKMEFKLSYGAERIK